MKITVFGMHEHIPGQDLGAVTRFDVKDAIPAELEERVLNALQSVAVFSYQKSDGTERVAIGTVNPALIPDTKELKRLEAVKNLAESLVDEMTDNIAAEKLGLTGSMAAKATAIQELITPKETKPRKASTTSVAYYDLTVGEWCSYKPETLLSLLDITG